MGSTSALEHVGDRGGVQAVGGFTVDAEDLVAGTDSGFVGGCAFEGIEDNDFGFAAGVGCGWMVMPTP